MSYQVIARKWRPKNFNELVGQNHISQTLLNALRNERLPHALLFTGPRGTGKTSSARILAKSLRCPQSENFVPCDQCSECRDISLGSSMDVIEIDGASNNGVDAVRELRDTVSYMPSSGSYKVYIIDEVHMLSVSAFNALLKTLEEPPSHVIFILATTEVHKIPNTILSRCQRFDFRRIATKKITEHLLSICQADQVQVDQEALWLIARQAEGSMRDSQSLLDQVITFCDGSITLQAVIEVLGLTDRGLLLSCLKALVSHDQEAVLQVIEQVFTAGLDPKIFANELLEEVRHLLFIKLDSEKAHQFVDLPDTEINELQQFAKDLSEEDCHLLFDMILKGANDIPRAQEPRLVLEMLLLRMAIAPRVRPLKELYIGKYDSSTKTTSASLAASANPVPNNPANTQPQRQTSAAAQTIAHVKTQPIKTQLIKIQEVQQQAVQQVKAPETQQQVQIHPAPRNHALDIEMPPASAPGFSSAVKSSTPPLPQPEVNKPHVAVSSAKPNFSNAEAAWSDLVQRIKNVNNLVAAQLEHTYLVELSPQKAVIGVPPKMKFLFDQISEKDFQTKISNYIKTFWGPEIALEIQIGSEKKSQQLTPRALEEKQRTDNAQKVRQQIEEHPLFKETQKHFSTQIRSIKELI